MSPILPGSDSAGRNRFEIATMSDWKTETWDMDHRMTSSWWLLAAVACTALATDPTLAARHGKSAPQTAHSLNRGGQGRSPGGASQASHPPSPVVGDVTTGNDARSTSVRLEPPAANGPTGLGNKSTGTAGGIDLVRPDDGYANLRHRAARSSPLSATPRRQPQIVAPTAATPHPASPAPAKVEPTRNSAGLPMPVHIDGRQPGAAGAVPPGPANTGLATGLAKNSLGLNVNETHHHDIRVTATTAPARVTGINGTTMGHAGVTGIGGPAKERSAIGGPAFRKF
jgi:hypothetical protein